MTMTNQRCLTCSEVWPCTSAHKRTHGTTDTSPMLVPVVTLTTGLHIANFSSPHTFVFTDGTVLPACSKQRAETMMLNAVEREEPGIKGTTDIVLKWKLTEVISREIMDLECREDIDIVIVPLPVMTVLKGFAPFDAPNSKYRVIRTADRVTKTIHHDRFCR